MGLGEDSRMILEDFDCWPRRVVEVDIVKLECSFHLRQLYAFVRLGINRRHSPDCVQHIVGRAGGIADSLEVRSDVD